MQIKVPEEITTERERELWRNMMKLYTDHCGADPKDFIDRTYSFANVMEALSTRIKTAVQMVVDITRQ